VLKIAERNTDAVWRNVYIVLYEVSWKQWELYEEVEDARYSPGGYFQFRLEFRHLERRLRSDEPVHSPNSEEMLATCSKLPRIAGLLIFISNFFHVSAAYMKLISSDRRSKQFVLSYSNNDNHAKSYVNELRTRCTYAICHCVYYIKCELYHSKCIRLLLRQMALLV
jgi:hypothetical protein